MSQIMSPDAYNRIQSRQPQLLAQSVTILRISLGLVILGFGALKFVPGLSPAEDIAAATVERLTFGLLSGEPAVVATAVAETVLGLCLVTGRLLRPALVVLAGVVVGWMSPLVLFPDQLFSGGPTLMAQYILKDVILAAAVLVVGVHSLQAGDREPVR